MLTLGEAARLTKLGKTTLARSIKAGRLSATRTDGGSYQIDPAELARVYPFPAPETVAKTVPVVHHATPDATADALVATLRETIADLRQDRDHWRTAFENMQRTLPAPAAKPVSWWRWLRSTG